MSIALNVLFASQNSEEITLVYKSEHKYKRENNLLLLITNDNKKILLFCCKKANQNYAHLNGYDVRKK